MKKRTLFFGLIAVLIGYALTVFDASKLSLLTSMNENMVLGSVGIQVSSLAFCLTSANNLVDLTTGAITEDDYSKQSIYSILYSLYEYIGMVESDKGVEYRFTFNTWGIAPSLFGQTDPERFGKTAYKSLILFDDAQELIKRKRRTKETLKILEIGCGTGAGANLITSEIQREFKGIDVVYTALDMQLAAINICKSIHESDALKCVQGNGKNLTFSDSTFDVVVVSETHIAEIDIDEETKVIIGEIIRVLKDGGLFLWGNALFTDTWKDIVKWLPTLQFRSCGVNNVTKGAVQAREEDFDRVQKLWEDVVKQMPLFQYYSKCEEFVRQILYNFYRHPGTHLFNTMVNGTDSYMQICNQITK